MQAFNSVDIVVGKGDVRLYMFNLDGHSSGYYTLLLIKCMPSLCIPLEGIHPLYEYPPWVEFAFHKSRHGWCCHDDEVWVVGVNLHDRNVLQQVMGCDDNQREYVQGQNHRC